MNSGYKQRYNAKNQKQMEINSNYDQRGHSSISPKNINGSNNSKSPTNLTKKMIQMHQLNHHSQKPLIQNSESEYKQTYNIIKEMSFSSKSPSSRNKASVQIPSSSTPSHKKINSQKSSQSQNKIPFEKHGNSQYPPQHQPYYQQSQQTQAQREFMNSSPLNLDRFENLNIGKQSMIQKNSFQKPNWVNLRQNNNIGNMQMPSSSPQNMHRQDYEEKRSLYSNDEYRNSNSQFQQSQQNYQSSQHKMSYQNLEQQQQQQQSFFKSPEFNYNPSRDDHKINRQIQFFDDGSKENYDSLKPFNSKSPKNGNGGNFNNYHNASAQQYSQQNPYNQKHFQSDYAYNQNQSQQKNNGIDMKIKQNMIFRETDRQLKEICQENEYFEDEQTCNQVNTILSSVRREKQVIMNDMNYLLCQLKKYKSLYQKSTLAPKQEHSENNLGTSNKNHSASNSSVTCSQVQQPKSQDQFQFDNNIQSSKKELSFVQESSIHLDPKQKAVNKLLSQWVSEDADGCLTFEADSQQEMSQYNTKELQNLENLISYEEFDKNINNEVNKARQFEKLRKDNLQEDKQKQQSQEESQNEQEELLSENETYIKMASLLSDMNIDPSIILPTPSNIQKNLKYGSLYNINEIIC